MNDTRRDRSPRLAILVSSDRRRGAEVFGDTLAGAVRNRGWDVQLFSLTTSGSAPRIDTVPLSSVLPDDLGRLDRSVVSNLRREVLGYEPDIVLANGAATLQYCVAALRMKRHRPRLVYVSIGEPLYWIRNSRHRMMRKSILKGADRVLSVSETTAAQLVANLGVPSSKVRVAPTGVPEKFFNVRPMAPEGHLRVVFIGNMSREKGPMTAMDVIERVGQEVPVKIRFLGGGPLRDEVSRQAARRGIADLVDVRGSVPDVLPHLAWADVLLLTSQTEGLPAVPLEAGAAGVCSVVFAVGGSAETVVDGVTGRVVPAGDRVAAAEALVYLANNPDVVRTWGAAARDFVRENFTLEASVDRYVDLLGAELSA